MKLLCVLAEFHEIEGVLLLLELRPEYDVALLLDGRQLLQANLVVELVNKDLRNSNRVIVEYPLHKA